MATCPSCSLIVRVIYDMVSFACYQSSQLGRTIALEKILTRLTTDRLGAQMDYEESDDDLDEKI